MEVSIFMFAELARARHIDICHLYMHVCSYVCMHVYYIYKLIYIYIHIYIYIDIHIYTYIYIHTHTYTYMENSLNPKPQIGCWGL